MENPAYLSEQIITYLGNKRTLLPFVSRGLAVAQDRLGGRPLVTLDLFSGSGVVARLLKQYSRKVIANDLEEYSAIANLCFLQNRSQVDFKALAQTRDALLDIFLKRPQRGFISELYSPRNERQITRADRCFYTPRNALFLDTIVPGVLGLPQEVRPLLLAPLLAQASVHANTSGVFKGFYKNQKGVGQFGGTGRNALSRILGEIRLELPILSEFECEFDVHRADADLLVSNLEEVDLAYLDPPYNQHPYGSNYFMLNLLTRYERPAEMSRVSGIPKNWNRSRYNQRREAAEALFELVRRLRAKFILISYNSEGFIPHAEFMHELKQIGRLSTLETVYNTFRGSRNLKDRPLHVKEFLFFLEKH